MELQTRWLIRRDFEAVLNIEKLSFKNPWTEEDFDNLLRHQKDCIGYVVEYKEKIIGFIVYKLQPTKIQILNLAIHPDYRREKVGQFAIERLIQRLHQQNRKEIYIDIAEINLGAQLFFKKMNFIATGIVKNDPEDCYTMRYTSTVFNPVKNRLHTYLG